MFFRSNSQYDEPDLNKSQKANQRHPQYQKSYCRGLESTYFKILLTRAYEVKFSKTDKVPM